MATIREFYKDKTVFITGASGFMGKVLLEKLLWSCSDLKQVLILIREKRGKSGAQRVEEFTKLPLFERIRTQKPELLLKVKPVFGDICSVDLGLSSDDLQLVTNNTNIIFHLAATIKFEAPLKTAVELNVRGVYYVINIAKRMLDLKVLVHVSTTFCCIDQEILEEKVYDWNVNPKSLINCTKWMSEETMEVLKENIIHPHRNTYAYTKRVAEILVRDEYQNLPIVISRPSFVLPTLKEPFPGWNDSFNGIVGLVLGAGKGIIRSMLLNPDGHAEAGSADLIINGLIVIPWSFSLEEKPETIPVFNVTCPEENRFKYVEIIELGRKILMEYPLEAGLWYPGGGVTNSKVFHYSKVFLTQWIPAYLVDGICFLIGKPRFLVKVQKKIAMGLRAVDTFTLRKWDFRSENAEKVKNQIFGEEIEIFPVRFDNSNLPQYMKDVVMGGRVHCLKEPLSTLPKARMQLKILYVIDKMWCLMWLLLFGWFCKYLFTRFYQN